MIHIPEDALIALNLLNKDHEAVLVGGFVRDALLNRETHDIDIATSATPVEVMDIFKNYSIYETGIKHGTLTVCINQTFLEITTYRIESDYNDYRRPITVKFNTSLIEDCRRRDFTINALCFTQEKKLIDYFNGVDDLSNKLIRAIGDPIIRFNEDALRILRAIRFTLQLNFEIEKSTDLALFSLKDNLKHIAIERIICEFEKMIITNNFVTSFKKYQSIFEVFIPEFSCLDESQLSILFAQLLRCPDDLILKYTCIFSNIKSAHNEIELLPILKRLKLNNDKISKILFLIEHEKLQYCLKSADIKRYLYHFELDYDYLLKWQYVLYHDESILNISNKMNSIIHNKDCTSLKQLQINGDDCIAIGFKGKKIKEVLEQCLFDVIDNKVENKKEDLINHCIKMI